jgi:rubrerythrin
MKRKQITNRMGLPDRAVIRTERLLSCVWMCSNCGDLTKADEPIPAPPPCAKCGRILFESVDLPSQ